MLRVESFTVANRIRIMGYGGLVIQATKCLGIMPNGTGLLHILSTADLHRRVHGADNYMVDRLHNEKLLSS